MYRITYEQGNGYRCGCCRRTSVETIDLVSEEEVFDWIEELHASFKFPNWEDEDDRELLSIEREIGVDISDQFTPRPDKLEAKIAERKNKIDDNNKKREYENRQLEYKLYLDLKNKFN
jgi:hypothetical protein